MLPEYSSGQAILFGATFNFLQHIPNIEILQGLPKILSPRMCDVPSFPRDTNTM